MPGTSLGSYAFIWLDETDRTIVFLYHAHVINCPFVLL